MLIFKLDLSSLDEATKISGRGVGIDIVKTNIKKSMGRLNLIPKKEKALSSS